jgi:uncharacterized membrane protein YfcA
MSAQQVWQSQTVEAPRITLEYVRQGASSLERRIRWRNALEYLGGVVVSGLLGFKAWHVFPMKPLLATAAVWFGLSALYGLSRRRRYAAAEPSPADAGILDTLRYQRRQLERSRDWRRRAWAYVLLTMLPGFALALASGYFENDPVPWKRMGFGLLLLTVAVAQAVWRSKLAERTLQREIDALDSLTVER